MAPTNGSRMIHDRYPESGSSTVGLPSRGSGCRDDACIIGIFDWASVSSFHRSSGDGEAGIGTATGTSLALSTIGADSSMTDGSRPRCRGEWFQTG